MKKEKIKKVIGKAIDIKDKNLIPTNELEKISKDKKHLNQYLNSAPENNFQSLLFEITHKDYTENEAKQLWYKITSHMKHLNESLSRDVGILVSSIDYVYNIENMINNPAIVEKDQFENIHEIVTIDNLTGLYIRNVFDILLNIEFNKAVREK